MNNTRTETWLTKTGVKNKYRFPESWIKRLEEFDKRVPNPLPGRQDVSMHLLSSTRVEAFIAEHREEYESMLLRWEKLSLAASKAAQQKREETLEWARTVDLGIRSEPEDLQAAADKYYRRNGVNGRGILDMLLHAYTDYGDLYEYLWGQVGKEEAIFILCERIYDYWIEKCGIQLEEPSSEGGAPPE